MFGEPGRGARAPNDYGTVATCDICNALASCWGHGVAGQYARCDAHREPGKGIDPRDARIAALEADLDRARAMALPMGGMGLARLREAEARCTELEAERERLAEAARAYREAERQRERGYPRHEALATGRALDALLAALPSEAT